LAQDGTPLHKLILGVATRVAFFFYWLFDNLVILGKIKFLSNVDVSWATLRGAMFWTAANFLSILSAIVELVEIGKEEVKLIAEKKMKK